MRLRRTEVTSPKLARLLMISTCSQQICWRLPNGIQHCANTRAESDGSAQERTRRTIARLGCSCISVASVSPMLARPFLLNHHDQASSRRRAARRRAHPCRDPPTGCEILQKPLGLDRGLHYGVLHVWPLRASISSAAFGPHDPPRSSGNPPGGARGSRGSAGPRPNLPRPCPAVCRASHRRRIASTSSVS